MWRQEAFPEEEKANILLARNVANVVTITMWLDNAEAIAYKLSYNSRRPVLVK